MSSDGDSDDRGAMLAALEAHGRAFLQSFPTSANPVRGIKRKRAEVPALSENVESLGAFISESADEWLGFGSEEGDDDQTMPGSSASIKELRELNRPVTEPPKVPVVVDFSHAARSRPSIASSKPNKAFMSSKVSKLREDASRPVQAAGNSTADDEEQLSDLRNDAELQRIIHTQLLSGSLDPMSDLKPSQKRKAMAGRVLEAAGKVRLGTGERDVRKDEYNKAAKRVREGIVKKQNERAKKDLEEAKQLGNYHPSIKRLFAASSQPAAASGKRARGIGSGVGRFVGGTLKLRKSEIASVQGPSDDFQGRRGKKGKRR